MRDYISIGSSPTDEDCAQVGADNYEAQSRKECIAFIHQLERQFKVVDVFRIKSFPHDFGTYKEVVCYFDDDNHEAIAFAYRVESECPRRWDSEALKELAGG